MKTQLVGTAAEAHRLADTLAVSAERAIRNLRGLLDGGELPLVVMARLKFAETGCDPLDSERSLNLIEQLNQTFTYQAAFQAAAWLIELHPERAPLTLNLGTSSGHDIVSHDGQLIAEVFATVDPRNNRKLDSDIGRLKSEAAPLKYVIYLSPTAGGKAEEYEVEGVRVRRLPEHPGREAPPNNEMQRTKPAQATELRR